MKDYPISLEYKAAVLIVVGYLNLASEPLLSQQFASGSTGADGALNVTENTVLQLPPDGIFHFTTVTVAEDTELSFRKNALNTPVYILATGEISILGVINVSGGNNDSALPGEGGPGGFDGGQGGTTPPGDGLGPGAGLGRSDAGPAGDAAFGKLATRNSTELDGSTYGNSLLVPLIGGSGGGGNSHSGSREGGGGGGGAILIASDIAIRFHPSNVGESHILAEGGYGGVSSGGTGTQAGRGSGGGIRLIAPEISGRPNLNAEGGLNTGGDGRLRIDSLDRSGLNIASFHGKLSAGKEMYVFPSVVPQLHIIEAAGTTITEGAQSTVRISLPASAPSSQNVKLRARDFSGLVTVEIVVTPESGASAKFQGEIDMSRGNPAETTISVEIPPGTTSHIHAWSK